MTKDQAAVMAMHPEAYCEHDAYMPPDQAWAVIILDLDAAYPGATAAKAWARAAKAMRELMG